MIARLRLYFVYIIIPLLCVRSADIHVRRRSPQIDQLSDHQEALPLIAVRLREGSNAKSVAKECGFVLYSLYRDKIHDHYMFEPKQQHMMPTVSLTNATYDELEFLRNNLPIHFDSLRQHPDVLAYERQVAQQTYARDLWTQPIDPLFRLPLSEEYGYWYITGAENRHHVHVMSLWSDGFFGENMNIVMIDDGIEMSHPDLEPTFNNASSWNAITQKPLGSPFGNSHGTPAASSCVGANNAAILGESDKEKLLDAHCGVGIAPKAKLGFVATPASQTDFTESFALNFALDSTHVYIDMSGPPDNGRIVRGPGTLTKASLKKAITDGRNGKGAVIVWSAGNGHDVGDECGMDGYVSSKYTIAIGSESSRGHHAFFSETCASLFAVTPSNGDELGIYGADLLGAKGYDSGDCTSDFGGTSASGAMAAGCMALLLEAAPTLTWLDVQGVLVYSCDRIQYLHASWIQNSANVRHSRLFGFGEINTAKAVQLAKQWTLYSALKEVDTGVHNIDKTLQQDAPFEESFAVTQSGFVRHVEVFISTSGPRGFQLIELISPFGTVSVLASVRAERTDTGNGYTNWPLMSVGFWDESMSGTWNVRITATNNAVHVLKNARLLFTYTSEATVVPAEFQPAKVTSFMAPPPTPPPTGSGSVTVDLRGGDCSEDYVGCAEARPHECCTGVCEQVFIGTGIERFQCKPLDERCSDKVKNGDEEGVDCGGSCDKPCLIDPRCTSQQLAECVSMCGGDEGLPLCVCEPDMDATASCALESTQTPLETPFLNTYGYIAIGGGVLVCCVCLITLLLLRQYRVRKRRRNMRNNEMPSINVTSTSNTKHVSSRQSVRRSRRTPSRPSRENSGITREAVMNEMPPPPSSDRMLPASPNNAVGLAPHDDRALPHSPQTIVCIHCQKTYADMTHLDAHIELRHKQSA